jgi:hypothetical protein
VGSSDLATCKTTFTSFKNIWHFHHWSLLAAEKVLNSAVEN